MALVPEAQTLLIAVAAIFGKPAYLAACVAGAWPAFADNTLPINTSCTSSGSIPARSTAALIAIAPRCVAETDERDPPKLPIGVRAAEMIYTSFILIGIA